MKTTLRSIALSTAFLLTTTLALQAGPALVGNKGLTGQKLDGDAIKAVLLGKKATLGNDRVVIVIAKSSDTQDAFLKQHVGMTTDQFQTHWRRLFMSGGGSAPKVVNDEAAAVKLVAETAGAIAVADSGKAEGLTVLAGIDPAKSPVQTRCETTKHNVIIIDRRRMPLLPPALPNHEHIQTQSIRGHLSDHSVVGRFAPGFLGGPRRDSVAGLPAGLRRYRGLEHEGIPSLAHVAALKQNLNLYRLHSYELMFVQESERAAKATQADNIHRENLDLLAKLKKLFPSGQGQQLVADVESSLTNYVGTMTRVRGGMEKDFAAAMQMLDKEVPPQVNRLSEVAASLEAYCGKVATDRVGETVSGFALIRKTALGFGSASIAFSALVLGLVMLSSHRIRQRLAVLVDRLPKVRSKCITRPARSRPPAIHWPKVRANKRLRWRKPALRLKKWRP